MEIEYVETNSSWFKDEHSAVALLRKLMEYGLRTLLISMSPFHNEYPFITKLYNNGIKALAENATSEFGFKPRKEYLNKCHLCFDIRKYLVKGKGINSKELQPAEYYDNV